MLYSNKLRKTLSVIVIVMIIVGLVVPMLRW